MADYTQGQTELAMRLVPVFLRWLHCPATLLQAESVSYDSRGMLRLKFSNPRAAHINEVISLAIQTFRVAVEVYETS
jgi:hypothetical protein